MCVPLSGRGLLPRPLAKQATTCTRQMLLLAPAGNENTRKVVPCASNSLVEASCKISNNMYSKTAHFGTCQERFKTKSSRKYSPSFLASLHLDPGQLSLRRQLGFPLATLLLYRLAAPLRPPAQLEAGGPVST